MTTIISDLDWEPVAGPRAGTVDFATRTYRQTDTVSPEELIMSLFNFSMTRDASSVEHLVADASADASTPIGRMPGSAAERIAHQHTQRPYGVADALRQFTSLLTVDITFRRKLPDGFFASLPPTLERLRVRVTKPLSLALEHVTLLRGVDWSRFKNLRTLELPGAWSQAEPSVRDELSPACSPEIVWSK